MMKSPRADHIGYAEILAFHNAGDLAFLKSFLHAAEIDHFIQGEHVAHYLFNAVPMRLMVRRDQVARALKLLADLELSAAYDGLRRYP
ncbi:MAG: DUF2007 domain-containing protein [Desulfosarcinaceae bacterium]|nr:DUF2007 domain-containing protein [Desulfosarcinaceae bacterium]